MKPKLLSGIGALFAALLIIGALFVPAVSADRASPEDAIDDTGLSERLQCVMNSDKLPEPQNQTDARDHIRTVDVRDRIHTVDAKDHIHTVHLSDLGKAEPLAVELNVGDLYFNESWSTSAIASIGDYTLSGIPEDGIWIKPWVRWEFSDTDWWACGDVHFEFTTDGGTAVKICPDGLGTGDSDLGILSPAAFLVHPGNVYDFHGSVYRGEESDKSSGRLYVYG